MIDFTLTQAKDNLIIDKNSLDHMVIEQSRIFAAVGEQTALASSERDAVKEALKEVQAVIANDFRRQFKEKGEKITEAKLSELVLLDNRYKSVKSDYDTCKLRAERWTILKESYIMRAGMLKVLCDLYAQDYYSRESVVIEEERKQHREAIRKRIKKDVG